MIIDASRRVQTSSRKIVSLFLLFLSHKTLNCVEKRNIENSFEYLLIIKFRKEVFLFQTNVVDNLHNLECKEFYLFIEMGLRTYLGSVRLF